MFVIPAPGLKVLDPETYIAIPAEGMDVPATEYWMRRLRDADVLLASQLSDAQPASKKRTAPAATGVKS